MRIDQRGDPSDDPSRAVSEEKIRLAVFVKRMLLPVHHHRDVVSKRRDPVRVVLIQVELELDKRADVFTVPGIDFADLNHMPSDMTIL